MIVWIFFFTLLNRKSIKVCEWIFQSIFQQWIGAGVPSCTSCLTSNIHLFCGTDLFNKIRQERKSAYFVFLKTLAPLIRNV